MVLVILLATLPIAGIMSFQLYAGVRSAQARIDDELARSAAALAQTVERELLSSIDALAALSQSESFQGGRVTAAGRLLQGRPRRDWHSVFLMDGEGAVLLDTASARAPAEPDDTLRELHQRVLHQLEPVVSGRFSEASGGAREVSVAIPVTQGGVARYVLGARRPFGNGWPGRPIHPKAPMRVCSTRKIA